MKHIQVEVCAKATESIKQKKSMSQAVFQLEKHSPPKLKDGIYTIDKKDHLSGQISILEPHQSIPLVCGQHQQRSQCSSHFLERMHML